MNVLSLFQRQPAGKVLIRPNAEEFPSTSSLTSTQSVNNESPLRPSITYSGFLHWSALTAMHISGQIAAEKSKRTNNHARSTALVLVPIIATNCVEFLAVLGACWWTQFQQGNHIPSPTPALVMIPLLVSPKLSTDQICSMIVTAFSALESTSTTTSNISSVLSEEEKATMTPTLMVTVMILCSADVKALANSVREELDQSQVHSPTKLKKSFVCQVSRAFLLTDMVLPFDEVWNNVDSSPVSDRVLSNRNHTGGQSFEESTPISSMVPQLAVIMHTSGSTAPPKLVPLTHTNIMANQVAVATLLDPFWPSSVCSIVILPLYHGFALLSDFLRAAYCGSSVCVVHSSPASPLTVQRLVSIIHQQQGEDREGRGNDHILCTVPYLLEQAFMSNHSIESNRHCSSDETESRTNQEIHNLTDDGALQTTPTINNSKARNSNNDTDLLLSALKRLRFVCFGGATLSVQCENLLVEHGVKVCAVLGLTEAAGTVMVSDLVDVSGLSSFQQQKATKPSQLTMRCFPSTAYLRPVPSIARVVSKSSEHQGENQQENSSKAEDEGYWLQLYAGRGSRAVSFGYLTHSSSRPLADDDNQPNTADSNFTSAGGNDSKRFATFFEFKPIVGAPEEGWWTTGDLFSKQEGFLTPVDDDVNQKAQQLVRWYHRGREDDLFKLSSGITVNPAELEDLFRKLWDDYKQQQQQSSSSASFFSLTSICVVGNNAPYCMLIAEVTPPPSTSLSLETSATAALELSSTSLNGSASNNYYRRVEAALWWFTIRLFNVSVPSTLAIQSVVVLNPAATAPKEKVEVSTTNLPNSHSAKHCISSYVRSMPKTGKGTVDRRKLLALLPMDGFFSTCLVSSTPASLVVPFSVLDPDSVSHRTKQQVIEELSDTVKQVVLTACCIVTTRKVPVDRSVDTDKKCDGDDDSGGEVKKDEEEFFWNQPLFLDSLKAILLYNILRQSISEQQQGNDTRPFSLFLPPLEYFFVSGVTPRNIYGYLFSGKQHQVKNEEESDAEISHPKDVRNAPPLSSVQLSSDVSDSMYSVEVPWEHFNQHSATAAAVTWANYERQVDGGVGNNSTGVSFSSFPFAKSNFFTSTAAALFYVKSALGSTAWKCALEIVQHPTENIHLIAAVKTLATAFIQRVPFQSISTLLVPPQHRRMPTASEICSLVLGQSTPWGREEEEKELKEQKEVPPAAYLLPMGGQCFVLNVFWRNLLASLGLRASYGRSQLHGLEVHSTTYLHSVVIPGDVWLTEVAFGYFIPEPICLTFSENVSFSSQQRHLCDSNSSLLFSQGLKLKLTRTLNRGDQQFVEGSLSGTEEVGGNPPQSNGGTLLVFTELDICMSHSFSSGEAIRIDTALCPFPLSHLRPVSFFAPFDPRPQSVASRAVKNFSKLRISIVTANIHQSTDEVTPKEPKDDVGWDIGWTYWKADPTVTQPTPNTSTAEKKSNSLPLPTIEAMVISSSSSAGADSTTFPSFSTYNADGITTTSLLEELNRHFSRLWSATQIETAIGNIKTTF